MYCFVDRAETASAKFVEQGVLTCRTGAGNRVGLSWVAILAGPWRHLGGMVEISLTWFPETVAGRRHGGLSESWGDVWSVDTCKSTNLWNVAPLHVFGVRPILFSIPASTRVLISTPTTDSNAIPMVVGTARQVDQGLGHTIRRM